MEPIVLGPGEGETITDRDGRFVQIKVDVEALTVTHFRYAAGERGPDRHVHREHADCFWVLDGELTLELGSDETVRHGAGAFVLVPPAVVHTFRNDGPAEVEFLNVHAPSKGFGDHLRGSGDGFDQFDPPADGGRPASDAVVFEAGAGDGLSLGASRALIKAGRDFGGGLLSLTETMLAPGFPGPLAHRHRSLVDSFWVLDGELTVRIADRTVAAGPGTYAFVSPGTVHTFSNPGEGTTRMLNLMAPGGFEQYLKEAAVALAERGEPDPAVMAEIASRYDFEPAAD